MNPVRTFDEISEAVLDNDYDCITMGILLADADQHEAKEYIVNYMNRFDKRSGKYIDFYIPGYFTDFSQENAELQNKYHHNSYVKWEKYLDNPVFELERTGRKYYFDRKLFERFLEEISECDLFMINKDDDEFFYINYFYSIIEDRKIVVGLRNKEEKYLDGYNDKKIREKYMWLRKKMDELELFQNEISERDYKEFVNEYADSLFFRKMA